MLGYCKANRKDQKDYTKSINDAIKEFPDYAKDN